MKDPTRQEMIVDIAIRYIRARRLKLNSKFERNDIASSMDCSGISFCWSADGVDQEIWKKHADMDDENCIQCKKYEDNYRKAMKETRRLHRKLEDLCSLKKDEE